MAAETQRTSGRRAEDRGILLAWACGVALTLAACGPGPAGRIEWEWTRQEVRVAPGAGSTEVKFRFRNAGDRAVALLRIDADCRCTVAGGRLRVYEPGEDGELPIQIHFGSDWGRHRKRIRVQTDEPGGPWHLLEVDGRVGDPLAVRPQFVWWAVGAAPEPRTVEIAEDGGVALEMDGVRSGDPRIAVAHETLDGGRRHRLTLTPTGTGEPFGTAVEFQVRGGKIGRASRRVQAAVK